jgi:hypothetical protein
MIVTAKRRRSGGMVRTRGGKRNPVICMVAIRRFIAAKSFALRLFIPKV